MSTQAQAHERLYQQAAADVYERLQKAGLEISQLEAVGTAARAVIAAGRPHEEHPYCECRKCKVRYDLEMLLTPAQPEPDANPGAIYHDDRGDN